MSSTTNTVCCDSDHCTNIWDHNLLRYYRPLPWPFGDLVQPVWPPPAPAERHFRQSESFEQFVSKEWMRVPCLRQRGFVTFWNWQLLFIALSSNQTSMHQTSNSFFFSTFLLHSLFYWITTITFELAEKELVFFQRTDGKSVLNPSLHTIPTIRYNKC